jgi:hypothetical protein
MRKLITTCAVAAMVIVSASSAVFGTLSYTSINNSPPSGEKNHAQILHDIYGGTFSPSPSGKNYIGSTGIHALRVYDSGNDDIRLNLFTGTPDDIDQIWADGVVTLTAEVKYAALHQSFGWNGGGTGTTYHELLTQEDIGGSPVIVNIPHSDFLWGCWPTDRYKWQWDDDYGCNHWWDDYEQNWHRDWSSDHKWWSLNSKNADHKDHMITYKIEGLVGPQTVWLIFMEDLNLCQADKDYNDFVVQISATPEPATVALLGLGVLSLIRRRKNS